MLIIRCVLKVWKCNFSRNIFKIRFPIVTSEDIQIAQQNIASQAAIALDSIANATNATLDKLANDYKSSIQTSTGFTYIAISKYLLNLFKKL